MVLSVSIYSNGRFSVYCILFEGKIRLNTAYLWISLYVSLLTTDKGILY